MNTSNHIVFVPDLLHRRCLLVVDDDPDDQLIVREAFEDAGIQLDLHFFLDGDAVIDFLKRTTRPYKHMLILLDLNLPRKNGHVVLQTIRATEEWSQIPVVFFSTSRATEDINRAYELGANAFVSKPHTFQETVRALTALYDFWFDIASLPDQPS